jgi:hypothetical protein
MVVSAEVLRELYRASPEAGINPKLFHRMNQAGQVLANDLRVRGVAKNHRLKFTALSDSVRMFTITIGARP